MSSAKDKVPSGEKKGKVEGPVPELVDEDKIDAPSRQTMVMLAVICASTLVLWGAGRAACNYRVPGESLTPRKVSLEERTRTPKDVGLALAQAVSGGDFKTAEELATGDALAEIKKEAAACGECEPRKQVRSSLMSVSTVLEANSVDSLVKVRTIGGAEGEQERFMGIERQERNWRVTRFLKSAEGVVLKTPPVRNDAPAGLRRDGVPSDPIAGSVPPPDSAEPEEIAPQEAPEE